MQADVWRENVRWQRLLEQGRQPLMESSDGLAQAYGALVGRLAIASGIGEGVSARRAGEPDFSAPIIIANDLGKASAVEQADTRLCTCLRW